MTETANLRREVVAHNQSVAKVPLPVGDQLANGFVRNPLAYCIFSNQEEVKSAIAEMLGWTTHWSAKNINDLFREIRDAGWLVNQTPDGRTVSGFMIQPHGNHRMTRFFRHPFTYCTFDDESSARRAVTYLWRFSLARPRMSIERLLAKMRQRHFFYKDNQGRYKVSPAD